LLLLLLLLFMLCLILDDMPAGISISHLAVSCSCAIQSATLPQQGQQQLQPPCGQQQQQQ
jgi:hypothetical protein